MACPLIVNGDHGTLYMTNRLYDGAVAIVWIIETPTLRCLPWTVQTLRGQPRQAKRPQIWEGKGCLCKIDVSQSLHHLRCYKKYNNERFYKKKDIGTCMACRSLFLPNRHQRQDWLPEAAGEPWVLEELSCCSCFPSERRHWAIFLLHAIVIAQVMVLGF